MITTEYSVAGPAQITIAIVADLHEFEPKPVLSSVDNSSKLYNSFHFKIGQ